MKKLFFFFVLLFPIISTNADIGEVNDASSSFIWSGEIGGLYLPSEGTIKVLFIFAQSPDDNFTGNSSWPLGQAPSNMNNWVDETWSSNPTQGSMTHYFNEMSFNKLKFTGKSVSVITSHTREWYLDSGKYRGDIHKEIIQQLDETMDFAQFDNWHYQSNYNHENRLVKMIIVVWRNIANDAPNDSIRKSIFSRLNMG